MSVLYCWTNGIIEIGRAAPVGALALIRGSEARLYRVRELARAAYDGTTWLVPGVPEARGQIRAAEAARAWVLRVTRGSDVLRPAWEPEKSTARRRSAA